MGSSNHLKGLKRRDLRIPYQRRNYICGIPQPKKSNCALLIVCQRILVLAMQLSQSVHQFFATDLICISHWSVSLVEPWQIHHASLCFFQVFFFYWRIVDLHCCVSFQYTAKWFSHTYTYIHFFRSFLIQVITEYWVDFSVLYRALLILLSPE